MHIVIDSGQVRVPRFEPRRGMTRLRTTTTSRASAEQRAGRAGRLGPGVAYRLWSEAEHSGRRAYAAPEIAHVDLAGFTLELAAWGAAPHELAFLDPPPPRAVAEAQSLLVELGALDADHHVTAAGRAMAELPVHPRLAHMLAAAGRGPAGPVAGALAALLEERDVLRGRPDELPANIGDRVELILDRAGRHPAADGAALSLVRRRAKELERRAPSSSDAARGRDPKGDTSTAVGPVLALAYPDRIAQARGEGRFRLRNGAGAWLPTGDALIGEAFLVVADLGADAARGAPGARGSRSTDDDGRIRLAAALDAADVESSAAGAIRERVTLQWDNARDDLRQRTERRLGAIVLAFALGSGQPRPGDRRRAPRSRPQHGTASPGLDRWGAHAAGPGRVRPPWLRRRVARPVGCHARRRPRFVVGSAPVVRHRAY